MVTETDLQKEVLYTLPAQGEWTCEDYARLPDNGMRYEVIGGDLYMSAAPRPRHQKVSFRLEDVCAR